MSTSALAAVQCAKQVRHPSFGLKRVHYFEWIFFVTDLLQFALPLDERQMRDHVLAFGVLVADLGSLFQFKCQPRFEASGADHQSRVIEEAVVRNQPQKPGFDICHAVGWVHQEAVGAFIQGDGHGVDREIQRSEMLLNADPVVGGTPGLAYSARRAVKRSIRTLPGKQR